MDIKKQKKPEVDGFPNDSVHRLVLWYGCEEATANSNVVATVFVQEVEIDANEKKLRRSSKIGTIAVAISDLDIVKIGSIWKGRKHFKKGYARLKIHEYNIDFELHPPETLEYKDLYYSSVYLPSANEINLSDRNQLFKSRLTKLTSSFGETILISSLEYLTGALVPEHKGIRRDLLQSSIDDVVHKYLKKYEQKGNIYAVYPHKDGHSDRNLTFLAYLAMNPVTRSRMSKILASMVTSERFENGQKIHYRSPIVLPCHPKTMIIKGEGIMLDNNTFLIFRIKDVSDMTDFIIQRPNTDHQTKPTENKQAKTDEEKNDSDRK